MCIPLAGLRRGDAVKIPRVPQVDAEIRSARALLVTEGKVTRVPTNADFERFLTEAAARADELIQRLKDNELDPRGWADSFKELLNDGHASAWILGRRRAGDLSEATDDDELIGIAYGDSQADFLLGFLDDLEGERYLDDDGELMVSAVRARAHLYVQVMRGTSGAAFVATSEPDELFDWVMGAVEDHCDDCPDMEARNPWDQSTLFATPGSGETACLGNCKCSLVRHSDKLTSFAPVSLNQ